LASLCRVLRVSRSGYMAWRDRAPSGRSVEEQALLIEIRKAHYDSEKRYGSPNIYMELNAAGVRCSVNRVARIMRKYQISAQIKGRFVVTTDSKHNLPVAENLLQQNFRAEEINTKWTGDITYIPTAEGWLFLAVLLDLWSRRAVGWSMKSTMDRSIVIDAFNSAYRDRRPGAGLICHSDRGSQYASGDYQELLKQANATCSMSGKGNCYDNAPAESFFASLKRDLLDGKTFATRKEARVAIFQWIAVWYNRRRRHSYLGYLSPEEFEQQKRRVVA
jgi:putative transposase